MTYWDWYHSGDGNPERTKLLKAIKEKDIKDLTEKERLFYKNELVKKQEKLAREAAELRKEHDERIAKYDRSLGLD